MTEPWSDGFAASILTTKHNGLVACKAWVTGGVCDDNTGHVSCAISCINWVMSMDTLSSRQRSHGLNVLGLRAAALGAMIHRTEKPEGWVFLKL